MKNGGGEEKQTKPQQSQHSCCRSRRKKSIDGGLSHRRQKLPLLKTMVGQPYRLHERMVPRLMIRTLLLEETERLFQSLSGGATRLR